MTNETTTQSSTTRTMADVSALRSAVAALASHLQADVGSVDELQAWILRRDALALAMGEAAAEAIDPTRAVLYMRLALHDAGAGNLGWWHSIASEPAASSSAA